MLRRWNAATGSCARALRRAGSTKLPDQRPTTDAETEPRLAVSRAVRPDRCCADCDRLPAQCCRGAATGLAAQRAPWGNMFEFTITAMVFVVGVYLILVWRAGLRWLGLPVTLLAAVGNGLAVTVFYVAVAPLVPALHSVWFLIHIVAAAISGAAFNVGGLLSILYLIKKRAEERGDGPRLPRAVAGHSRRSTCSRTGSTPSPSRCGPSPSPPARSGRSTPGAATGAGTPRRPGPWSPG